MERGGYQALGRGEGIRGMSGEVRVSEALGERGGYQRYEWRGEGIRHWGEVRVSEV